MPGAHAKLAASQSASRTTTFRAYAANRSSPLCRGTSIFVVADEFASLLAVALGSNHDAIQKIFDFIWGRGGDVADPAALKKLGKDLGVADIDALVENKVVKEQLIRNGEAAIAAGTAPHIDPSSVQAAALFGHAEPVPAAAASASAGAFASPSSAGSGGAAPSRRVIPWQSPTY